MIIWDWDPIISNDKEKLAYDLGREAYLDDKDRKDNPYNNNDEWELAKAWNKGFDDAAWDD